MTTKRPLKRLWQDRDISTLSFNERVLQEAEDERNPPETGLLERELKRIKNARLYLVPASPDTRGHGTTASAKWWKHQLQELLQTAPKKAM